MLTRISVPVIGMVKEEAAAGGEKQKEEDENQFEKLPFGSGLASSEQVNIGRYYYTLK